MATTTADPNHGVRPTVRRPPHPGRGADAAGVVVTAYLSGRTTELRAAELAVRGSDRHGVHDLRVTVRRLRCTLRMFRSVVGRDRAGAVGGELDALVDDPRTKGRAARPATRLRPKLVGKAYRRADRAARRAADRGAALHEVRKAVQRLRYAAELATPVVGAPAERTRKRARRVQRVLGDHHDTVVLRSTPRELGSQAALAGTSAFTFGLLHGRAGAAADRLERRYDRCWRRPAAGHAG